MLCSSGRAGVGYEGDTCSFTCNTGYKLTGSDNRTCRSNGSWSGEDTVCRKGIYYFSRENILVWQQNPKIVLFFLKA